MAISNEELRKQLAEALKAVNAAQEQTKSLAQISALRKALEAAIPLLEQPPPPPVGSPGSVLQDNKPREENKPKD